MKGDYTMAASIASDAQVGVADRIKQLLNKKGKSRKDIAVELRVTTETLNSWASRGSIKRENLLPFARYCGVTTDYILSGDDDESEMPLIREKGQGLVQEHKMVKILETENILSATELVKDTESVYAVYDQVMQYAENPKSLSEVFIPFIRGHRTEEELPGEPAYAFQIATDDHDSERAADWHGAIVAFATDMWPTRGDFCMFLRRMIHGEVLGPWTLHTGFFRSDARAIPTDADTYWQFSAEHKPDRHFVLKVREYENAMDDVIFNYSQCQWIFLGVAVWKSQWRSIAWSLARTRLMDRKYRRLKLQKRKTLSEQSKPFE